MSFFFLRDPSRLILNGCISLRLLFDFYTSCYTGGKERKEHINLTQLFSLPFLPLLLAYVFLHFSVDL